MINTDKSKQFTVIIFNYDIHFINICFPLHLFHILIIYNIKVSVIGSHEAEEIKELTTIITKCSAYFLNVLQGSSG